MKRRDWLISVGFGDAPPFHPWETQPFLPSEADRAAALSFYLELARFKGHLPTTREDLEWSTPIDPESDFKSVVARITATQHNRCPEFRLLATLLVDYVDARFRRRSLCSLAPDPVLDARHYRLALEFLHIYHNDLQRVADAMAVMARLRNFIEVKTH